MTLPKMGSLALAAILIGAVALGLWGHDRAQAVRVWAALEVGRMADRLRFDAGLVADLPEVAQRHLTRAIAPGIPLDRVVRLEVAGAFILNGRDMPKRGRSLPRRPGASSGGRRSAPGRSAPQARTGIIAPPRPMRAGPSSG